MAQGEDGEKGVHTESIVLELGLGLDMMGYESVNVDGVNPP